MSLGPFELPATNEFERQSDLAFGCCHRKAVAVSGPPIPNPGVILLSSNPDIRAVRRVVHPEWFHVRIDRDQILIGIMGFSNAEHFFKRTGPPVFAMGFESF